MIAKLHKKGRYYRKKIVRGKKLQTSVFCSAPGRVTMSRHQLQYINIRFSLSLINEMKTCTQKIARESLTEKIENGKVSGEEEDEEVEKEK